MWICPKCKQKFVNRNQWHSCRQNTIENFLKGKSPYATELFYYFVEQYKKIGEFELHPAKTRIAFVADIRFCSITKLGKDFIEGGFLFDKPYHKNKCFYKIYRIPQTEYYPHLFRLYSKKNIDAELKKFMKLAYAIGKRKHIKNTSKTRLKK